MLLDMALQEDRALLRVEAAGDIVGGHLAGDARDLAGLLVASGQRVPVGDAAEHLVLILQAHPAAQRALQVAQVQRARSGRLHGTQQAFGLGSRHRWCGRLNHALKPFLYCTTPEGKPRIRLTELETAGPTTVLRIPDPEKQTSRRTIGPHCIIKREYGTARLVGKRPRRIWLPSRG